jgi:catechol 2,3-dioxygenase-like lactoylglutathione lyase family enzyme
MMTLTIATVTLVVDSYDRALAYYCGVLGLTLVADTPLGDGKRWVVVAGAGGAQLLLAEASDATQRAAIGNQTGGRVGFFMHSDDFAADHARLLAAGVTFREAPRHEAYGTVAVFEDIYGNGWDLIQPRRE